MYIESMGKFPRPYVGAENNKYGLKSKGKFPRASENRKKLSEIQISFQTCMKKNVKMV